MFRETLVRLVQINSVNPTLVPGAPGEREIAGFIADSLAGCGLTIRIFEPEPGRLSVLGTLEGSGGGRSLMLNAHCDTVDTSRAWRNRSPARFARENCTDADRSI